MSSHLHVFNLKMKALMSGMDYYFQDNILDRIKQSFYFIFMDIEEKFVCKFGLVFYKLDM